MASRVVDLSSQDLRLPDQLAIDTNVIVTRLIRPRVITPEHLTRLRRVRTLLEALVRQETMAFVTPTALVEFMHAAIRSRYAIDPASINPVTGRRTHWELLFKARPDLLPGYEGFLRRVLSSFPLLRLAVLQPTSLGSILNGERLEQRLLTLVLRYQLDSNDASILLEMERAGIESIVTEDPDLRRAAGDFNVYTWL